MPYTCKIHGYHNVGDKCPICFFYENTTTPHDELDKEAKELQPIPLPVSFLDWVSDEKYMRLSKSVGKWFKMGVQETYTSTQLYNLFKKEIDNENI